MSRISFAPHCIRWLTCIVHDEASTIELTYERANAACAILWPFHDSGTTERLKAVVEAGEADHAAFRRRDKQLLCQ
jgi:hypothetical protein